jgi:hypothetical protein
VLEVLLQDNEVNRLQFYLKLFLNAGEPGSSGSIVSGYGLDDRAIRV